MLWKLIMFNTLKATKIRSSFFNLLNVFLSESTPHSESIVVEDLDFGQRSAKEGMRLQNGESAVQFARL